MKEIPRCRRKECDHGKTEAILAYASCCKKGKTSLPVKDLFSSRITVQKNTAQANTVSALYPSNCAEPKSGKVTKTKKTND